MRQQGLIYTNDACVGCNRCIKVCSCIGACISTLPDKDGNARIEVDHKRCITCGACFDACEHGARTYLDDTERFFQDLAAGEDISILIAPSFRANYPEAYGRVLGTLKKLGAKRFVNVSFGADITTWGYIRYLEKTGATGMISQPCPAVVSYILRHQPSLIPKLMPVHSPVMCAAIYTRKELRIKDRLAFISPCIAKKKEVDDPDNGGVISYNVTFQHLMDYLRRHNLNAEPMTDEVEYGLGSVYPMPGGLRENLRYLLGDAVRVREISGTQRVYRYLDRNREEILRGEGHFLLYDLLNCEDGCLCGTGTEAARTAHDQALDHVLDIRDEVTHSGNAAWGSDLTPAERLRALKEQFAHLKLADYMRTYTDRSAECAVQMPTEEEFDAIYRSMNKTDAASRGIDCMSCGYDTCEEMAIAIHNGFNHRRNCILYLKSVVEDEKKTAERLAHRDGLTGVRNMYAFQERKASLDQQIQRGYAKFAFCMADVNWLKVINDAYGHEHGDVYLQRAAELLRGAFPGCPVYRTGGDEFVIFLEGEKIEHAEEMITELETRQKELEEGALEPWEQVSFACGLAVYDKEIDEDSAAVLHRADEKMYQRKSEMHVVR